MAIADAVILFISMTLHVVIVLLLLLLFNYDILCIIRVNAPCVCVFVLTFFTVDQRRGQLLVNIIHISLVNSLVTGSFMLVTICSLLYLCRPNSMAPSINRLHRQRCV